MPQTARTPIEKVVHAANLYHRGVICPAESWREINRATTGLDLRTLLDALSANDQELLRSMHRERPLSLESLAEENSQFATLLKWCVQPRR